MLYFCSRFIVIIITSFVPCWSPGNSKLNSTYNSRLLSDGGLVLLLESVHSHGSRMASLWLYFETFPCSTWSRDGRFRPLIRSLLLQLVSHWTMGECLILADKELYVAYSWLAKTSDLISGNTCPPWLDLQLRCAPQSAHVRASLHDSCPAGHVLVVIVLRIVCLGHL